MKKLVFTLLIVTSFVIANAQEVISAAGETNNISGYEISWTLGETVIQTFDAGSSALTQGLHQSKLQVTAIDELSEKGLELKIYPNPTSDFITISFDKMPENPVYSLFDLSGKLLENRNISEANTKIEMQHFPGGSYILKMTNKNQLIQTFKIIKQ